MRDLTIVVILIAILLAVLFEYYSNPVSTTFTTNEAPQYVDGIVQDVYNKDFGIVSSNNSVSLKKYYYSFLTKEQRDIYNKIERGCKNFESTIQLNGSELNDVYTAKHAVDSDNPSFYWTKAFTISTMNNRVRSIEFNVPNDAKSKLETINTIADAVIQNLSGNDVNKLKMLYDWVVQNTEYGRVENDQDITSVFLNRVSVCSGYTKAFQLLCDKAGIDCTIVSGTTNDNESHVWNMVRLGDYYYWVDVTWGDPTFADFTQQYTNYNYFLVSDLDFLNNHIIDKNVRLKDGTIIVLATTFPACSDDSLNYYRLLGCYFEKYNEDAISDYIMTCLRQGNNNNIEFKFANKQIYDFFINKYLSQDNPYIFKMASRFQSVFGGKIRVAYSTIESAYYVSVSVEY